MVAVPVLVRRVVFPLLVALGTLLGKYRKYADAPAAPQSRRVHERTRSRARDEPCAT